MADIFTGIWSWDSQFPQGTGKLSQADDQLRGVKNAVEDTFPGIVGVVNASHTQLNSLVDYTDSDTVETRLTDIETILGDTTAAQLDALEGISPASTIEERFDAVATWIGEPTNAILASELQGLDQYNTGNGTIESRLQSLQSQINSIITGGEDPQVGLNKDWITAREANLPTSQTWQLASYGGISLPAGYSGISLGDDIGILATKMTNVEDQLGINADSSIVWHNVVASTNAVNIPKPPTDARWGFGMRGCKPGTNMDFQFYYAGWGGWGRLTSVADPNKLYQASETGEGFARVKLVEDDYGPSGQSFPADNSSGYVKVNYTKRDGTTDSYQIECRFV